MSCSVEIGASLFKLLTFSKEFKKRSSHLIYLLKLVFKGSFQAVGFPVSQVNFRRCSYCLGGSSAGHEVGFIKWYQVAVNLTSRMQT